MRLLIFGRTGMLGSQVYEKSLVDDTWSYVHGTTRNDFKIDYENVEQLKTDVQLLIDKHKPNVVINCLGLVKPYCKDNPLKAVSINSHFPSELKKVCSFNGVKLVHVSTDCVYSGSEGGYNEKSVEDVNDFYGASKLWGDDLIRYDKDVVVVRSSIIGQEFKEAKHGLVEWFLKQKGNIKGFGKAFWSGFTTNHMSLLLLKTAKFFVKGELGNGLYVYSSGKVDKYQLLCWLKSVFEKKNVEVDEFNDFKCDRSLASVLEHTLPLELRELINFPLEEQLKVMGQEWKD